MEAPGLTSSLRDNHASDLDLFWGNWISVKVFCCSVDWFSVSGRFLFFSDTVKIYYFLELLQGRVLAWTEAVSCAINLSYLSSSDLEAKRKMFLTAPVTMIMLQLLNLQLECGSVGDYSVEFWTLNFGPSELRHLISLTMKIDNRLCERCRGQSDVPPRNLIRTESR